MRIWGTSKVPDINGLITEHAGRALRSQFILGGINTLPPRDHFRVLGLISDVIIFDLLFDAAFPNGRELTDEDRIHNSSLEHFAVAHSSSSTLEISQDMLRNRSLGICLLGSLSRRCCGSCPGRTDNVSRKSPCR